MLFPGLGFVNVCGVYYKEMIHDNYLLCVQKNKMQGRLGKAVENRGL